MFDIHDDFTIIGDHVDIGDYAEIGDGVEIGDKFRCEALEVIDFFTKRVMWPERAEAFADELRQQGKTGGWDK